MKRPKITDNFPSETTIGDVLVVYKNNKNLFQYAQSLDLYINELEKQRDELIELLKKVLIVSPISAFKMSELQDEIEELLNKIQSNG